MPSSPEAEEAQKREEFEQLAEELSAYKIRAAAYKKIIERYADFITASEQKTVPQLKELVKPLDPAVVNAKKAICGRLAESNRGNAYAEKFEYDHSRDFPKAAELSLDLVKSFKPVRADLSVSYWLSPSEVEELGAADPLDKAIFLCSLLRALECKSARVRMVELEGRSTHPLVLFEFEGKSFLVDPGNQNAEISGRENVTFESQLAGFKANGLRCTRSLYEFNDLEYEEFE
ncbi:MAG: hypothetical protein WC792_00910 [Candidatus Micrarchaeia archaeon]|jgi:hypothetical protein